MTSSQRSRLEDDEPNDDEILANIDEAKRIIENIQKYISIRYSANTDMGSFSVSMSKHIYTVSTGGTSTAPARSANGSL